ncbi:MAG: efflux RND transporter periplasmic adaptor subunit [Kiritimatiellia bacterium]
MKMNLKLRDTVSAAARWAVALLCISVFAAEENDPHTGHDHGPVKVPVTQQQVETLGIKISRAAKSVVRKEIRVPGEIRVNSDVVAHVVPRAAGIVREVLKSQGDKVKGGEVLAWIESEELAEAKLDFFAKEAELATCDILLPRAEEIFENVSKLIKVLSSDVSEKNLKKLDGLEMGKYRGLLLPAYMKFLETKKTCEREQTLSDKKISSQREFIAAETAFKRAEAEFQALVDTAGFETKINYSEAARKRQLAAVESVAAEQRLRLKGADDELVAALRKLVPGADFFKSRNRNGSAYKEDKLLSLEQTFGMDKRFAWYALKAPFDGVLLEKHIARGESVENTTEVFIIADLSTVWVDLALSQNAITQVRLDQPVKIFLPDGAVADARTDFVSPVIDEDTRTARVRAVLSNPEGRFRPGTFIEAGVGIPTKQETVVVPKASVQSVSDHPVVFVWGDMAFEMREVETGYSDGKNIEILSGLKEGEAVVSVNAFHLKAELSKSGSGPSCSHGHAH